jgi:hypothetical protein
MFSRSVKDTSRVIRMTIISDSTTWSVTSDDSRGVIYNCNIFIIQATDHPCLHYGTNKFKPIKVCVG